MIMKVTDVLPMVEQKLKIDICNYDKSTLTASMVLLFRNVRNKFDDSRISERRDKIIQIIQARRCNLFSFFG